MGETTPKFKVGDKVVYNIDGLEALRFHRPYFIETFKSITHGVVIGTLPLIGAVNVQWIDYKGFVVFPKWGAATKNLELYKP